jgi:hypothetical protein
MYLKSKMRLLGMSALVSVGLVAATSANAYNVRLGGVDIQVDTIASAGVSVRVADRETALLPVASGGPKDTRAIAGAKAEWANPALAPFGFPAVDAGSNCDASYTGRLDSSVIGSTCVQTPSAIAAGGTRTPGDNYDGSINSDDGRMNFDNGDLTGGTIKFNSDIEASLSSSVRAFARVTGFYDAVMASDSSFETSALTDDASDDATMKLRVLDAYIDYDGEVAGMPLLVRAGKQVINWGESTFFLGGNSIFNSIDVSALTRPGAEIKEALLPVEALYASVSLPYDLSVEAYVGGWSEFEFVRGGSPMANSDMMFGSTEKTNELTFIGGGSDGGGNKMNCNSADSSGRIKAVVDYMLDAGSELTAGMKDCDVNSHQHFTHHAALGDVENERRTYDDTSQMLRGEDEDSAGDNVGLAVRWYAEALNSTEFGFYYQKNTSRIPYAAINGTGAKVAFTTTGAKASSLTRIIVNSGSAETIAGAGTATWCGKASSGATALGLKIGNAAGDEIKDPYNVFAAFQGYANATDANPAYAADSDLEALMDINCALSNGGSNDAMRYRGVGPPAAGSVADVTSRSGEMFMSIVPDYVINFQYPQDIETIGMSAATTVLGWGVQSEVAYRRNMPLQIDTDSMTIAANTGACVFQSLGNVGVGSYLPKATIKQACNTEAPGVTNNDGFLREEVYNFDIGTTATFTRSNPVIAALGADIGILLTEFGYEYVPNMDLYRLPASDALLDGQVDPYARLQSRCTAGSDLGLGGLLSLDARPDNYCRPTSASSQGMILARLVYNNVFGTPMSMSPTVTYREGIAGIGATPTGSVEGNSVLGVSVGFDLQGTWSGSVGYTDYDGDVNFNRMIDRDQVSLSVSYAY